VIGRKEHPFALVTPLTVPEEAMTEIAVSKKQKTFTHFEHPFRLYCRGQDFSLVYSRTAREPFTADR
jgi:hypothetical protein